MPRGILYFLYRFRTVAPVAMRIGELARRSGVGVSTLRAWERRFGFLTPERTSAGHRLYSETDLERVATAVQLLGDGLTLPAAIAKATANAEVLADGEDDHSLYGQILYAADDGVWVSRHGRTRYVNRRMTELMQMPAQELLARSALDFFDATEMPATRERASRLQRGERVRYRQQLRRPNGTTFLADIKATPLLNAAGGYEGTVALVQDVTEIAEHERAQTLRDALLDGVSDAVAASTPDGTVVYVNTAAEHLFGWRAAEVVGRNGVEVLPAPDAADEAERIFERLAVGKRYAGFIRLMRNDGTTFLAHAVAKPVYVDSGELVGYVTTISDRSVHQQLERSTRASLLRAETLAQLGAQALQHLDDPDATRALVATAVDAAVHVLDADRARTFDEDTLNGFAMYVRRGGRVLVLDDTELDRRFASSFADTTRSAIGAPILGPAGIRAVLVVEGRRVGQFGDGASFFVEGIANVIGCALLHGDAVSG